MEWVEVRGKTVEIAVQAAIEELGLESATQAEVKVIQEPERGFLGMGGRDAVVQVKAKPKRRRRTRGKGRGDSNRQSNKSSDAGRNAGQGSGRDSDENAGRSKGGGKQGRPERKQQGGSRGRDQRNKRPSDSEKAPAASTETSNKNEEPSVTREEQAEVVREFLVGLLDAFGLEGTVTAFADDEDIIHANVSGEQTEALVGPKGAIMQSVHELARTVVQRQTHENVRLRLDIAGYGERRREALAIYAGRLAEQVKEDGAEVMLEPMNPADRKVIHDAVQALDGVRSYSEGEEPRRSVVISPE